MKLFIEALVSAVIALFVLNFFGISLYSLTSLTAFFVILLVMVIIEEKTGISNRKVVKQMRLERPIISTVISFMILILLAFAFSIMHDRISILITPIINSSVELGLLGLALVLAVSYRGFYHIMFKGIELDTGIDLGIKKRLDAKERREHEAEKRKRLQERLAKEREKARKARPPERPRGADIQRTVEE